MKKLIVAGAALAASTQSALACAAGSISCQNPAEVPEISALQGTAAIAAVAAVVLLAWERSRRAA